MISSFVDSITRASILRDYWGDIKEDWGSGDPSGVQGHSPSRRSGGQSPPAGSRGGDPVGGLGDEVSQKLKLFCETNNNIGVKIQQTTVSVTRVNILNDITSKILGGHYHGCPPFINIGGTCPPCPTGIDAPAQ